MSTEQVYRTYIVNKNGYKNVHPIPGSAINKPTGGLWGCRGTEWDDWCKAEEFRHHIGYYGWKLKEGAKVYTIEHENDFFYLAFNYMSLGSTIDFKKLAKDGYDAVELTSEMNLEYHLGVNGEFESKNIMAKKVLTEPKYCMARLMALNSWDVPSICVFDPEKTVEVVSGILI